MKERKWMYEYRATKRAEYFEAIRNGMTEDEAFDEVYEYKFDEETLKRFEEDRAYYESTEDESIDIEVFTEAEKAEITRICDKADERLYKLPKQLYEVDEEEHTIVQIPEAGERWYPYTT